jgi:hypothetical protein
MQGDVVAMLSLGESLMTTDPAKVTKTLSAIRCGGFLSFHRLRSGILESQPIPEEVRRGTVDEKGKLPNSFNGDFFSGF